MRVFLAVCCLFLSIVTCWGQQAGDYRSTGSGSWTTVSNWQFYNGSSWVAATSYPGQLPGTNDVAIIGGNTIVLNGNIPNAINALYVGDGTGATDAFEVNNNAILNTPLIELLPGGFAEWTNNVSLFLPSNAAFKISGGQLDDGKPCSAAKRLVIGSRIYSTCNGGAGVDYSFEDLDNEGGTLAVNPNSDSPVCEGENLNLYANPSGAGSSTATYTWLGTGPDGYVYNGTDQSPVISGLSAGNYSFTVTIRDSSGYTYSDTVEAEVTPGVQISSPPADQQGALGGTLIFSIAATGVADYQWQVSDDGGGNYSDLTDDPTYSGTTTSSLSISSLQSEVSGNLYRVVLTPVNPNCTTTVSPAARLTVIVPTAITNRRITFRVNQ